MNKQDRILDSALDTITAAFQEPQESFSSSVMPKIALWHCMRSIAKKLKIVLLKPLDSSSEVSIEEYLQSICDASLLQLRTIELTGKWWKKDMGPILGFYESYEHPVAIIPKSFGRYVVIIPSKNINTLMTEEIRSKLFTQAIMFYPTLPEKKLNWLNLIRFSAINMMADGVRILLLEVFIALFGFILPISTGVIFAQIIPNAARSIFWQFIIILSINTFVITLFQLVLAIGVLRIRLKTTVSLQAAIWDRVIRLPISFFRQFTAGDLADRASGIDSIQQLVSDSVFVSVSSGVLSLISLFLMFYYSITLAIMAIILTIVVVLVALFIYSCQLGYLKKSLLLHGKLTGQVLEFISSISKIKMTNSIHRVFLKWSETFSEKNRMSYLAGKMVVRMTVFTAFFSIISTIIFFCLVFVLGNQLSFGSFITFNVLFSEYVAALVLTIGTLSSVLAVYPLYERIKPILHELPEKRQHGLSLVVRPEKIDLINVSFRYSEETPIIFKNLNVAVQPGELVAFVGPSGVGKSTLFRLLLGLEQPQFGKIYFSDMDLSNLNIRTIRKQTGVVLQDSVLFHGTIWENIVGYERVCTEKEVQAMLENVGIAEEVNALPMGLHTVLTEQGKTLSGGQRQRLILARALLKRPKLLLLDEATSALDNITQEKIYNYIVSLNITCLVIAHRTSTLRFAKKIYVIDNGSIVESGSFQELIDKKGLFSQLAKRQL